MSSKPRREYDVYLKSELSLGIACGELMVPPNAEVFKVREVLEGDTEAADEIERLKSENSRMYADHILRMHDMVMELANKDVEIERLMNAMELAWELVANAEHIVGRQVIGWQSAFQRWRHEEWHPALDRNRGRNDKEVNDE